MRQGEHHALGQLFDHGRHGAIESERHGRANTVSIQVSARCAAAPLGFHAFLKQLLHRAQQAGRFKWLAQDHIRAGIPGVLFFENIRRSGGEDDRDIAILGLRLHVARQLESILGGQVDVGNEQVGTYIIQAAQGDCPIRYADNFDSLTGKDLLAKTQCLWTVVRQQDAAHSCG